MRKRNLQAGYAIGLKLVMLLMIAPLIALGTGQSPSGLLIKARTQSGDAIAGASVRLERSGNPSVQVVTGSGGDVRINGVTPGQYKVVVSERGFQESTETLTVLDERQQFEIEFILIPKIQHQEAIDVVASAPSLDTQNTSPPVAELRAEEVTLLPAKPNAVTDALPLVPGVTKTANGEIQISGASEQQSALLVNATDVTDPATGRFGTTVPVSSVESIAVLKTPFLPQYGSFTAAVVAVETKRGGEKWRFSLKDPVPSFRIRSGHIRGLKDTLPKVNAGGPLIAGKLYASQSIEYALEKRQIRTLSFPNNESKSESSNSFTQLDYILSPKHFVTATIHVTPKHINFVDLRFFDQQPVTPSYRGFERAVTVTDHGAIGGVLLDSSVSQQQHDSRVGAQGDAEMVLTPTGNSGNYFARQHREASRLEWSETLSITKGAHILKFGAGAARSAMGGGFSFMPVEIRDREGRRIERIEFTGGAPYRLADMEEGLYAQDHFRILPNVTLDGGVRLEHQAKTGTLRMAPRVGAAWRPFGDSNTVVRTGIGVFYDHVPLKVYSFSHYPEQSITRYDSSGQVTDSLRLVNITSVELGSRFRFLHSRLSPGNFAPYSHTWTVEVERTLSRHVNVRVNYRHSDAGGRILLTPSDTAGTNALVLGGDGRSTYRELEVTSRISWRGGQQMMASFVHSKARGDLNRFDSYLDDFAAVPLRPNRFTNLPGDIPNRLLVWGFVNLPFKLRVAPIAEYRTGEPYAVLDAARNYVGMPLSDRMRHGSFVSFDERFIKDVKAARNSTLRFSISVLNTLNHFNSLDVHRNTADPQFGTFFGHYKRRYRADIELLF